MAKSAKPSLPPVEMREGFPKADFSRDQVEEQCKKRRSVQGVLDCRIEDGGSQWVLVTTIPNPDEEDAAPPAAPSAGGGPPAGPGAASPAAGFPTPREAITLAIDTWEGLWQANPADSGNWAHCRNGSTKLLGTMRGITPDVFAEFQGIDPCGLTADILRELVTLKVAVDIALKQYFSRYRLDRLLWSPVAASAFDAALLSGGGRATRMVQQLVGANPDGAIGPQTTEAFALFLESHDIADACDRFADIRIEFYRSISEPGTKNAQFRQGWINRANWSRPSSDVWWKRWEGWQMPHPAGSTKATGAFLAADMAAPTPAATASVAPPYVAPDPAHWLGQVVDNGQCVRYVQVASGAPHTSRWSRGIQVKGNSSLRSGSAIATFDPGGTYGNHTDGRSHAAIYLGQNESGLIVLDQWVGQPVHQRTIRFGGGTPVNDGNSFDVIM